MNHTRFGKLLVPMMQEISVPLSKPKYRRELKTVQGIDTLAPKRESDYFVVREQRAEASGISAVYTVAIYGNRDFLNGSDPSTIETLILHAVDADNAVDFLNIILKNTRRTPSRLRDSRATIRGQYPKYMRSIGTEENLRMKEKPYNSKTMTDLARKIMTEYQAQHTKEKRRK